MEEDSFIECLNWLSHRIMIHKAIDLISDDTIIPEKARNHRDLLVQDLRDFLEEEERNELSKRFRS